MVAGHDVDCFILFWTVLFWPTDVDQYSEYGLIIHMGS